MKYDFVKLHGLGNDFVFIDDKDSSIELSALQVASICDRHFGVGADGVILVRPSENKECAAYMHYINSDGSLAQMCGNGVRCFAKYLVDRGVVDAGADSFVADTLAGPKPITFEVNSDGKLISATVDMGEPILEPKLVPTTLEANAQSPSGTPYVLDEALESPWGDFSFTCISMGNPHAVCFIDNFEALPDEVFLDPADKTLETFDINKVGAYFEAHPAFPEKTNVEFAEVGPVNIAMRVFERGCGETLACGTGTCATSVAATLSGRSGAENDVKLLGGTLHILWDMSDHVFMTGPAEESFTGTLDLA